MCIIRFDWLIALHLFISLVCNASFLIVKTVVSGKKSVISTTTRRSSDLAFHHDRKSQRECVYEIESEDFDIIGGRSTPFEIFNCAIDVVDGV